MPDHPFEFFDGGVSPIEAFKTDCEALLALQEASAFGEGDATFLIITTPPIAFVSLMAFSEGFFKSTFGAVGNMSPKRSRSLLRKDAKFLFRSMIYCFYATDSIIELVP